ncbi:MAG: hypothetical protein IJG52_08220 [Lachnospiraceae bacterium]|nr:hypothetical protein [Lachnospiraceae bacterium]
MPKYVSTRSPGKKRLRTGRGAGPKKQRSALIIVLNVLIGVLTIVFLIAAAAFMQAQRGSDRLLYFGDKYILRSAERHQYAELIENYYYDHADFRPVDKDYDEALGVAEYADAAMQYAMYDCEKDAGRTSAMRERMLEAEGLVSLYEPELDRIDEMAGTQGVTGR